MSKAEIRKRARRIKAIVSDVDGVLTDGSVIYGGGEGGAVELKAFHVRDGLGVKLARQAGLRVILLSGRYSAVLRRRSRELGVDRLWQRCIDKRKILDIIKKEYKLKPDEICYIGDDLPDIPPLADAGLAVSVPAAPQEVRDLAVIITKAGGGEGALREIVEFILKAQDKWRDALTPYRA